MITQEVVMDIVALRLHRKTVKKFILGRRMPEYRRSDRRASVLAPFVRVIQDWLGQDSYRASWIFGRLKQIGYEGSYETVKKFVRPFKEQ